MSKIDELKSHPAFPGGLVTVLQEFEGRIAAVEARAAALEAKLAPKKKVQTEDQQSTTGVVDNS